MFQHLKWTLNKIVISYGLWEVFRAFPARGDENSLWAWRNWHNEEPSTGAVEQWGIRWWWA